MARCDPAEFLLKDAEVRRRNSPLHQSLLSNRFQRSVEYLRLLLEQILREKTGHSVEVSVVSIGECWCFNLEERVFAEHSFSVTRGEAELVFGFEKDSNCRFVRSLFLEPSGLEGVTLGNSRSCELPAGVVVILAIVSGEKSSSFRIYIGVESILSLLREVRETTRFLSRPRILSRIAISSRLEVVFVPESFCELSELVAGKKVSMLRVPPGSTRSFDVRIRPKGLEPIELCGNANSDISNEIVEAHYE